LSRRKHVENDGYKALRLGFEDIPEKRLNKPEKGLFAKVKAAPKKYLREFRTEDIDKYEVGQEIKVADMFSDGDKIDVSGISKGKGFQGVVKRLDMPAALNPTVQCITEELVQWVRVKPGKSIQRVRNCRAIWGGEGNCSEPGCSQG
jgi:hypothetical protein